VVGGYYADRSHRRQGFVATEDNGKWTRPIPLPGLAAVNKGGFAQILSLMFGVCLIEDRQDGAGIDDDGRHAPKPLASSASIASASWGNDAGSLREQAMGYEVPELFRCATLRNAGPADSEPSPMNTTTEEP
jgi:hypothetical protein